MATHENDSSVAEFYAGKSVFVTGGTGFLGKVMIEKLLYSCADIDKIYLLVRDKKGVSALQRIQEICNNPLFKRLKQERPHDLKKLIPIVGDVAAPNLGLEPDDEEMLLEKVSLVFHSAATIKFNEPLKDALKVNVEGTRHVLGLCKRMKNIEVFVHTSTAFTKTDQVTVDEVVYPPPADLDEVYQLLNQQHTTISDSEILNGHPNTYTFSKALAESLIERNHGNIRTVIIRPSIVTAIKDEPAKGWINNWYGATGILTSSARGLNRFVFGSKDVILDLIPADYVANCTIVAAAKRDRYVKMQSLIIRGRDLLEYFTSHSWVMKCEATRGLHASLSDRDRRMFPCDPADIDWKEYIPIYCEGIKRYLEEKLECN